MKAWIAPKEQKLTRQEIRRMKKLWAEVPNVRCQRLCQAGCTKVPVSPVETYYLIEKHKATLTPDHHNGNFCLPTLGAHGTPCEFLKDGECSIHEDRPLICRLYGHPVLTLHCQHNCECDGKVTEIRAGALLRSMWTVLSGAPASGDFMGDIVRETDHMTVLVETADDEPLPDGMEAQTWDPK